MGTVADARTMMRAAHKVYEPRRVNYGEYTMIAVLALENNLQYAKAL